MRRIWLSKSEFRNLCSLADAARLSVRYAEAALQVASDSANQRQHAARSSICLRLHNCISMAIGAYSHLERVSPLIPLNSQQVELLQTALQLAQHAMPQGGFGNWQCFANILRRIEEPPCDEDDEQIPTDNFSEASATPKVHSDPPATAAAATDMPVESQELTSLPQAIHFHRQTSQTTSPLTMPPFLSRSPMPRGRSQLSVGATITPPERPPHRLHSEGRTNAARMTTIGEAREDPLSLPPNCFELYAPHDGTRVHASTENLGQSMPNAADALAYSSHAYLYGRDSATRALLSQSLPTTPERSSGPNSANTTPGSHPSSSQASSTRPLLRKPVEKTEEPLAPRLRQYLVRQLNRFSVSQREKRDEARRVTAEKKKDEKRVKLSQKRTEEHAMWARYGGLSETVASLRNDGYL